MPDELLDIVKPATEPTPRVKAIDTLTEALRALEREQEALRQKRFRLSETIYDLTTGKLSAQAALDTLK